MSAYLKYNTQKQGAKRRNIPWGFTFETWVDWWEAKLGPNWIKKRGKHLGQYQMARKGDKGPYAPGNVECLTVEDHFKDRSKNSIEWGSGDPRGPIVAKLPQIEKLLLKGHTVHAIATMLRVSSTQIYRRFPEGVRSVMQKRGVCRLYVCRWGKRRLITLKRI